METENKTYLTKFYENGVYRNNFWNMKGVLEYVDEWFLMESPIPLIVITLSYLIFVLKLGPAYMKSRQPYDLRTFIICYNVGQIITSTIIFYLGLNIIIPNGLLPQKCLVSDELIRLIANATYYYFICKLLELLDTVFFVLRKKQSHVSFLHVYHHTVMMCSTWLTLKIEPSYATIFLGTLNTFVHIIMYTYYALSAFPNLNKYLWWKKYITTMQMLQFLLVLLQAIATYIVSECKPSYILGAQIMINALLFLFLFGDFYVKSYIKNEGKKSDNDKKTVNDVIRNFENGKEANGDANGEVNGIKYRNSTIKSIHS